MLSQRFVERCSKPGRYRDGVIAGLLLQVTDTGTKSFVLRYQLNHVEHMLGLGRASDFTLKEARQRARSARQLLADGLDPLNAKRAAQAAAKAAVAKRLTFREAAEKYFDQHQSEWRSVSHRDQFLTTLTTHIYPTLGDLDVATIATADVLRALEHKDFWTEKTITADRTRSRVEAVLDWATVRNHRSGDNPARWKGHLDQVLSSPRKTKPVVHHAAMAYAEVPAFMTSLRADTSVAARALEFLILTAARTGEVRDAVWSEINFDEATWTIPAAKMKNTREHRVALSPPAVALLRALPREKGNLFVFIGPIAGRGLSRMAMTYVMQRLGQSGVTTIHGFRSAFSDWAHESTAHSNHTIEISLAHNVGNEVERAYRRGPMLAKRVKLMADWAKYCAAPARAKAGNVVAISGGRRR